MLPLVLPQKRLLLFLALAAIIGIFGKDGGPGETLEMEIRMHDPTDPLGGEVLVLRRGDLEFDTWRRTKERMRAAEASR